LLSVLIDETASPFDPIAEYPLLLLPAAGALPEAEIVILGLGWCNTGLFQYCDVAVPRIWTDSRRRCVPATWLSLHPFLYGFISWRTHVASSERDIGVLTDTILRPPSGTEAEEMNQIFQSVPREGVNGRSVSQGNTDEG
jgi:hypothetical protein